MENEQQDLVKVKRYNWLAVIFSFLLALLWPVGGYFFWILGGAIIYFLFLAWFYSPRKREEPSYKQTWRRPGQATTGSTPPDPRQNLQRRIRMIVLLVMGSFFFLLLTFIIIGIMSDDSTLVEEEIENVKSSFVDMDNVDAVISRGNEFYNQGQYDSAMFYYDKALQLDPGNQFAQYDKALIYYSQENYRTSARILKDVLKTHSDYGYAYYLLGDNYEATHRTDSAMICFEKAYQYEVRDAGLLQNMGDIYAERGNSAIAIKYYKEALGQDSTLVDVYKALADLDKERQIWYRQQAKKYE